MLNDQLKIFKPKLYIFLELIKSELVQSVFKATLTVIGMVNMKRPETDSPRFDPKTISIFPNTFHFTNS